MDEFGVAHIRLSSGSSSRRLDDDDDLLSDGCAAFRSRSGAGAAEMEICPFFVDSNLIGSGRVMAGRSPLSLHGRLDLSQISKPAAAVFGILPSVDDCIMNRPSPIHANEMTADS